MLPSGTASLSTVRDNKSNNYRDKEWLLMEICEDFPKGICTDSACTRAHCQHAENMKRDRHSNRIFVCFQHLKGECKVSECKYYHAMDGQKRGINQMGRIRQLEIRKKEAYDNELRRLLHGSLFNTTGGPFPPTCFYSTCTPTSATPPSTYNGQQQRPLIFNNNLPSSINRESTVYFPDHTTHWLPRLISTASQPTIIPLSSDSCSSSGGGQQLQLFNAFEPNLIYEPFFTSPAGIFPFNCMGIIPNPLAAAGSLFNPVTPTPVSIYPINRKCRLFPETNSNNR